jgi:adenylosuccinate synthase
VHVPAFFKELKDLEAKGLQDVRSRIFISDRAHVVFDLHQLVDGLEEVELGASSVGTTRKGIGPTYSTKAARSGVRISEIFNEKVFNAKLRSLARGYKIRYGDLLSFDVEAEIEKFNVGWKVSWTGRSADGFLLGLQNGTRSLCCGCRAVHQLGATC